MGIFSNFFDDDKPIVSNANDQTWTNKTIKAEDFKPLQQTESIDISDSNKKVIEDTVNQLYSILEKKKFLTYNDLFLTLDDLFITKELKREAYCFWMGDKEAWKKYIKDAREHIHNEIEQTTNTFNETSEYLIDLRVQEEAINHALWEER